MLKQEVESLSELDKSAELLIRLLCAVPGWSEKNVQVFTSWYLYFGADILCFERNVMHMI
jgi:hypothetical protein